MGYRQKYCRVGDLFSARFPVSFAVLRKVQNRQRQQGLIAASGPESTSAYSSPSSSVAVSSTSELVMRPQIAPDTEVCESRTNGS